MATERTDDQPHADIAAQLSYDDRAALKRALAADDVPNTKLPLSEISRWRAAADTAKVSFAKYVEDAVDAWAARRKRSYTVRPAIVDRWGQLGTRFPKAKVAVWRATADADGVAFARFIEAAMAAAER